jgi:hypothetical protein
MTRKITSTSHKKTGAGREVTAQVFGSIMSDTVGLWFAPASAEETIRKIKGEVKNIQNKDKKVVGEFEDKVHDPARNSSRDGNEVKENEDQ